MYYFTRICLVVFLALNTHFSFASIKNSIFIQGVITANFHNEKFVSIKDSHNQEYLLPRSLLEKKLGTKIDGKNAPSAFFLEISAKDYQILCSECLAESKKWSPLHAKMCPPQL